MRMTWATAEDYAERLLPYLQRVQVGAAVEEAIKERVLKPYRVKRERKTNG